MNLIPSNESIIQKSLEDIGSSTLSKFDTSKVTINPLDCDVTLLEHLAFSFDVDISGLEENEARTYLQNAREIKKYIGSVYAVKKAASTIYGEAIKVVSWEKFDGVPGTYKIVLENPKKEITHEAINKTNELINAAKRVSAKLSTFEVRIVEHISLFTKVAVLGRAVYISKTKVD